MSATLASKTADQKQSAGKSLHRYGSGLAIQRDRIAA
jgi:hypothetical protein